MVSIILNTFVYVVPETTNGMELHNEHWKGHGHPRPFFGLQIKAICLIPLSHTVRIGIGQCERTVIPRLSLYGDKCSRICFVSTPLFLERLTCLTENKGSTFDNRKIKSMINDHE